MRRIIAFGIMVLTLIAVFLLSLPSIRANIIPGIEFKGGFEILYEVSEKPGSDTGLTIDELVASAAETIVRRVDIAGVKNPQVNIEGNNTVRVTVAASSEEAALQIRELIESDADVSFRDVNDVNLVPEGSKLLQEGGATIDIQDGKPVVLLRINDVDLFTQITSTISARSANGENRIIIWLGFKEGIDGYDLSKEQTEEGIATRRKIVSDATVSQTISSATAIISGSFTVSDATRLADLIRAGTINFELTPISVNTIGASYGADAFNASIFAGLIGLASVAVFMIVTYGLAGVVSSLTLMIYVIASLLIFNMMKGEYGPDTIAATVISIGMAVDAHIISYERMKDEIYKGRNLSRAFDEGNKKSFSSIFDANLTTLIAAFVLYFFGTRTVKGFATMLVISIFFTLTIIVYLSEFLLSLLAKSKVMQKHPGWFGIRVKDIPNVEKGETTRHVNHFGKVKFMNTYKFWIGLSSIIVILGAVSLSFFSYTGEGAFNFGLQFSEGSRIIINTNRSEYLVAEDQVKTLTNDFFVETTGLNITPDEIIVGEGEDGITGDSYTSISIRFKTYLTDEQMEILKTEYANLEDPTGKTYFRYDIVTVTPIVAQQTVVNAIWAVLWAFVGIGIYTAFRFKFSYAVAALLALMHDVSVTIAFFALFRFEVNIEFVSAILAIIGYSINDTIVAFDRLRENIQQTKKDSFTHQDRVDLVNLSLQQTVGRSIMTTVTTLFAVLALFLFGSEASRNFNIAMLVGLVSGTYSSIYIAPVIWIWIENYMADHKKEKIHKAKKHSNEPEEHVFIGLND